MRSTYDVDAGVAQQQRQRQRQQQQQQQHTVRMSSYIVLAAA